MDARKDAVKLNPKIRANCPAAKYPKNQQICDKANCAEK